VLISYVTFYPLFFYRPIPLHLFKDKYRLAEIVTYFIQPQTYHLILMMNLLQVLPLLQLNKYIAILIDCSKSFDHFKPNRM